jgi:hypothetical protein
VRQGGGNREQILSPQVIAANTQAQDSDGSAYIKALLSA